MHPKLNVAKFYVYERFVFLNDLRFLFRTVNL